LVLDNSKKPKKSFSEKGKCGYLVACQGEGGGMGGNPPIEHTSRPSRGKGKGHVISAVGTKRLKKIKSTLMEGEGGESC